MQNQPVIEHLNIFYLGDGRITVELELPWLRQQQSLRERQEMEETIEEGAWSCWLFAEKLCQCLVLNIIQVDMDCLSFPQKPSKSLNGQMARRTLVTYYYFYNEVKENAHSAWPHHQVPL